MDLRSMSVVSLMLFWLIVIPGCDWWSEEEISLDNDFSELILNADESHEKKSLESEILELNLNVGDRFPLLKTVKQTLSQSSPNGLNTSTSELTLLLTINVEEIRNGDKRMGVRYLSVRYTHDVAGEKLVYDSDSPESQISESVQMYHGLVNNGFSFWIGADNQIKGLVGFNDFLRRCVQKVPLEQRQSTWMKLYETSSENGLANFVDDSIGLLPYSADEQNKTTVIEVGQSWIKKRQFTRPSPMYLTTTYTLKTLSDKVAEIDVFGQVIPSATFGPTGQPNEDIKLTIISGHCYGDYTIDRETGLPITSRMERHVNMKVEIANGLKFDQRKSIVTTIRAVSETGTATTAGVRSDSGALQISATRDSAIKDDQATPAFLAHRQ